MSGTASVKLRQSFAIAGAAVVLPLLAVFLFNTLWGYLPLRNDVGKLPYYVHVTNAMRDLEVAVLEAAMTVHGGLIAPAASHQTRGSLEGILDEVKQRFSEVRLTVREWPQISDNVYSVYGDWVILREQARTIVAKSGEAQLLPMVSGNLLRPSTTDENRQQQIARFDAGVREITARIDQMIAQMTIEVDRQLRQGQLSSQRIYGLTVAIGLMVIMFIMWVNLRLARYVVDPVNGIVGSITQFRDGDYKARSGVQRRDEIGALANAFNEMAADIEQTHEHLASLSERDPLTGMLNRRGFDPRFERHLQHAEAAGRELGIVMVDIDHFKKVNDTRGHAVGDQVLVAVADTIRNCLRAGDFSARFGGEEFVICMPNEGRETGMAVAERIREAVGRLPLCDADGNEFTVTLSAGVAVYPTCGITRNEILRAGDDALYEAKRSGRNRVVFAEPDDAEALWRKAG